MTPKKMSRWTENPLPRLTDQRREDRLYGWLSSALSAAVAEIWILAEELWMIDGLVWDQLSPHDLQRASVTSLLAPLVFWPPVPDDLAQAALGGRKTITILTNLSRGPEQDFVVERSLLPRLAEVTRLLGVLAGEAERAADLPPKSNLVAFWHDRARQELSLPRSKAPSFPSLKQATPRSGRRLSLVRAAEGWGELAGWLHIASLRLNLGQLEAPFVGREIVCDGPGDLDHFRWEEMEDLLALSPPPHPSPATAWFLETIAYVHEQMLVLLPSLIADRFAEEFDRHQRDRSKAPSGIGLTLHGLLTRRPESPLVGAMKATYPHGVTEAHASYRAAVGASLPVGRP